MPVILTKVIDGVHRKATAYTKENNKVWFEAELTSLNT